jgi:GTP-binding protein
MLDQAVTHLPKTAETPQIPHFSLAIVGEPNVGKSTLLNAVLNEERAIVSEIAGTTRDSLEEVVKYKKHFIRLIDTAGMRHKKKIKQASDLFSLSRAKQSIQESDVTFLLFDAEIGIRRDTKAIAGFLEGTRKPALLVANKWDLVKKTEQALYEIDLKAELGFLKYAPLVFISARDKKNLTKVMDAGVDLWERSRQHIPTKELNRFLEIMKARRLPSPALRLKFLTQTSATPQQFVCFVRHKDVITKNYHAHFENELTSTFHLEGIPIQLFFREVGQKD